MSKVTKPPEQEVIKDEQGNPIYYYFDESKFVDGGPTGKGLELITLPGFDAWFSELKSQVGQKIEGQPEKSIPSDLLQYLNSQPSANVQQISQPSSMNIFLGAIAVVGAGFLIYKLFSRKKRGR